MSKYRMDRLDGHAMVVSSGPEAPRVATEFEQELIDENSDLNSTVSRLESVLASGLNPAAPDYIAHVALAQLWEILQVDNQTQACIKARELVGCAAPRPTQR